MENISKLKVYSYELTDDYADYAGLPQNARRDTGVLAQDVRDVLPDAVTETDDVTLPTGRVIPDFLVVNKVLLLLLLLLWVGACSRTCPFVITPYNVVPTGQIPPHEMVSCAQISVKKLRTAPT